MFIDRPKLLERFSAAVAGLDRHFGDAPGRHADQNVDTNLRDWLDGTSEPLPWAGHCVTDDEWFLITTLYGPRILPVQRALIRRCFPGFVDQAGRDIRNLTPDLTADWPLGFNWMRRRLVRMGAILRDRRATMSAYTDHLRELEQRATPDDPTPALDIIIRDHGATTWKTLSVFVRDCVGGNCFPIDSRVAKELRLHGLPEDERLLVSLSLLLGRNPRQIARMFYEAGGDPSSRTGVSGNMQVEISDSASPMKDRRGRTRHLAEPATHVPYGRATMTRELGTLDGLDTGYVLNLFGGPTGRIGNVVHPHDCHHLKRMTIPPRKIWGTSVEELEAWVKAQGGELDPTTPTCSRICQSVRDKRRSLTPTHIPQGPCSW